MVEQKPELLAPAGDVNCFLAALAAGADAVYIGLKQFSARMEAENFTLPQLASLTNLAHSEERRVYVAMNALVKPGELAEAYDLIRAIVKTAPVDGLIIQDLAIPLLARGAAFKGKLVFSTLANVSFPKGLEAARRFGAARVVIPRELSLDEMKLMGEECPDNLDLECFIHGALCYCVSGRCYWSSYMGGKSGLRGRCVQPCRRAYKKSSAGKTVSSDNQARYFSCQDLELGVLVKTLLKVPCLDSWKIEGRKKGPHYVYHTVTAYKLLRDYPNDPKMRAMALEILEMALGRPGVKANFLSQRPVQPMNPAKSTSSGLLVGKITFDQKGAPQLKPRIPLLAKDLLRIGSQDERWHETVGIRRAVPKRGALNLKLPRHKTPPLGAEVFLVDRREEGLEKLISEWREKLAKFPEKTVKLPTVLPVLPKKIKFSKLPDIMVSREITGKRIRQKNCLQGVWINERICQYPRPPADASYWLPPVIWPDEQEKIVKCLATLLEAGARNFVCNAPWQRALFPGKLKDIKLIAGPFCNMANALAAEALASAGFSAAFASEELSGKDLLLLAAQSPLPLGFVLKGYFPVGISRFGLAGLEAGEIFASPKSEQFWSRNFDGATWIYPAWPLDLTEKEKELRKAGFSFFAFFEETHPGELPRTTRSGLFNWNGELK